MKIALKRLTASDLTFFEWQYNELDAGHQKAINLNRNIFIDALYPALPELSETSDGARIPVAISIYGPGDEPRIDLQRKIIKGGGYKNWRLNGEFISNPPDSPERFNSLAPGDIAVFGFEGTTKPTSCCLILVSASGDPNMHAKADKLLGDSKMIQAAAVDIVGLLAASGASDGHPLRLLAVDEDLKEELEEAAIGNQEIERKIWKRRSGQKLSHLDLKNARHKGEIVGREGEEIINCHFRRLQEKGEIESYKWVADENAISPYDFELSQSGQLTKLDVKSTRSDFARQIHISLNEIREIAEGGAPYEIYRVYDISNSEAKLRIAKVSIEFATGILSVEGSLPNGVRAEGFTISPDVLPFGDEILIPFEDDEVIDKAAEK